MSLLGSQDEAGVRHLLQTLPPDRILALARTTTSGIIKPVSTKDATEVILLHTRDLPTLFSYKRLTTPILYQYLSYQKVPVPVSSQVTTREHLIKLTLDFWATHFNGSGSRNYGGRLSGDVESQDLFLTRGDTQLQVRQSVVKSDKFAVDFCQWFYTMLNHLQPVFANQPGDTLRENIFFSNCSADIFLIGQIKKEWHSEGQHNTFVLIKNIFTELDLLCSPNLVDGTQAQRSSHGLVKVLSCGTLHKSHAFVGIFEQEFGVMLDPLDRTWKVMFTKMNLKQSDNHSQLPKLPPAQVFEIENELSSLSLG